MAVSRQSSRSKSRFTLVLLILTTLTLLTLDFRGFEPIENAREAAIDAFGPVKDAANDAFEPVGDAWNGAFSYDELEAENRELRDEIEELRGALALEDDAQQKLEELYAELEIDYVRDIPTEVATVVYEPVSNFDHTIEIDKGRADGLAQGMPVISKAGLVGVVERVGETRSVVTLVTDPGFRVAIRLSEVGDNGVARGQGRGRPLVVFAGIDAGIDVPEGELATTSGLERTRFPRDVPVGEVTSTVTSEGELDQELYLEPVADLDALSFVNVMLWEPDVATIEPSQGGRDEAEGGQ